MPELTRSQRAAGSYVNADYQGPVRAYPKDAAGGLCTECGNPLPAALAGIETTHPTCDPDWSQLNAASRRAMRLRTEGTPS